MFINMFINMKNIIYDIYETEKDDVDLSSFDLKDELNDRFWRDNKLDIRARRKLLTIARDFINEFELKDFPIYDVIMTGSLANYNWSEEYSDIDLHIVVDFKDINNDVDLVKGFFDSVKSKWNETHDNIKIYGYPVEIYVQDVNEKHTSSGVYSILHDEWVTEPSLDNLQKQMDDVDSDDVQENVASFMTEIEDLEERVSEVDQDTPYDELDELMDEAYELRDRIRDVRKSSLGNTGTELSTGNLTFKTLRRNGYLERLRDIRRNLYDLIHSLE